MSDVEFIHRTGENITVVTIGQPRDTLEQKVQRARERQDKQMESLFVNMQSLSVPWVSQCFY